jgi:hypothetical protein
MVQYYPNNPKTILEDDNEKDYEGPDPGREIVERNRKERSQRNADYTKEELDKVLKRVDDVKYEKKEIICFFYSMKYFLDLK